MSMEENPWVKISGWDVADNGAYEATYRLGHYEMPVLVENDSTGTVYLGWADSSEVGKVPYEHRAYLAGAPGIPEMEGEHLERLLGVVADKLMELVRQQYQGRGLM